MNWTSIVTWIVVTATLSALSCALLGNFLLLRKMSMMGDAISHAVLPGIAIAFILTASRASGYTDWTVRFDGAGLNAFGEVIVDRTRVESDGMLSVLYQRASSGSTPSPIRVVDFRLG